MSGNRTKSPVVVPLFYEEIQQESVGINFAKKSKEKEMTKLMDTR